MSSAGAANSVRSLSPLGDRVGVRGLPAELREPNPLTHSFLLQHRVALSPQGRGQMRRHRASDKLGLAIAGIELLAQVFPAIDIIVLQLRELACVFRQPLRKARLE